MSDNPNPSHSDRDRARRKAQSHFELAEARTTLVKKMMDDERTATAAKTAKLRAQRLAREEEDRLKAAANPAPVSTRMSRARAKSTA